MHHVSRSTGLQLVGGPSSTAAAGAGGQPSAAAAAAAAAGGGAAAAAAPWKVVFSGDTRPCAAVVEAARGATLLIHEATFEDELAADAVAKRHSTLSEALGVARESGAYRTVLTHFSSRYPKIPVLAQQDGGGAAAAAMDAVGNGGGGGGGGAGEQRAEGAGSHAEEPLLSMVGRSVAVGFDFMTINLADLPWLPLVVPACDELLREEGFANEDDDGGFGEGGGANESHV